jgi:Zn-dependent peptidase ImmA (M78 family)
MTTEEQIACLLTETGETDPRDAVRAKARALLRQYESLFGEPPLPMDIEALASLRGVRKCSEAPAHSKDAELVCDNEGRPTMRVNPDRPETRQRFSMAHEVAHTFFPEYAEKVRCRTDHRYRDPLNPEHLLEILCDVGAAELLFPLPRFKIDARSAQDAQGLVQLADTYRASREATLRRYAETSDSNVVTVYLAWKLKPTQAKTLGNKDQMNLFGTDPHDEARAAWRLRIDYAISSPVFSSAGYFVPRDKSVENAGPLYEAASTGKPCDGECHLDLGQAAGAYRIRAVPLWTSDEDLGPQSENAVAAILEPLKVKQPKRAVPPTGKGLFE